MLILQCSFLNEKKRENFSLSLSREFVIALVCLLRNDKTLDGKNEKSLVRIS